MILLTRAPPRLSRRWARRRLGAAAATAVKASRLQLGPRGPQAVAASLTRGLTKLGLPFEVDPRRGGGTVGVLSDPDALAEAIEWRRSGGAQRLVAGPNILVLPSDAPALMTAREVDACVVPSEWVKRLYERDAPELRGRVVVWPAGVDAGYWSPDPGRHQRGRRALVYVKRFDGRPAEALVDAAQRALADAGFDVELLSYGRLRRERYRAALRAADAVVFFSPTESQCLAQVEAWSVDVPTLVWACGRFDYRGRMYPSSSAPYLSPATGNEFSDAAGLAALLARWDELRPAFHPRAWVRENMTDEICARAYWELAHGDRVPTAAAC